MTEQDSTSGKKLTDDEKNMISNWVNCGGQAAALVLEQQLKPVIGRIVFPPTFAPAKKGSPSDYIIDTIDGKGTVILDTPGSHANRLEPIFLNPAYADLVPQIFITGGEDSTPFEKSILELGHRAADALARSSEGANDITEAFRKILKGDASALAALAPTSLVFGVWDSRGTGAKIPRSIEATIRADDVEKLHRAAQYFASLKFDEVGLLPKANEAEKKKRSEAGFLDAPSGYQAGGVQAHGAITRTITINLVTISALGAGKDAQKAETLRRYILGLALVAGTAPIPLYLRQGCLLVANGKGYWQTVQHDGEMSPVDLTFNKALEYARNARDQFFGEKMPDRKAWKAQKNFAEKELKKRSQSNE